MMSSKSTKRAMLTSVLSMVLCAGMLIGTTFAWFTDSVATGKNVIRAGNLRISATVHDLESWSESLNTNTDIADLDNVFTLNYDFMRKGDPERGITLGFPNTGVDFEDNADFMSDTLFEPGKTYVKMIRVKNDGSLAAKIKLKLDIADDSLQDALWFAMYADDLQIDRTPMATIDEKLKDVEIAVTPKDKDGSLGYRDIVFAYGMREDADNRFQDKSFAATMLILAGQDTYENDSFGKDYDKDAAMPWDGSAATEDEMNDITDSSAKTITVGTAAELAGITGVLQGKTGYTVVLTNDIDLGGREWTPIKLGRNNFDGKEYTVSNFRCNQVEKAGLIGEMVGTVSNVTVRNAEIVSNHYAGAIVGYSAWGNLDNCHAVGVKVQVTTELQSNGGYDNGDKVGGIVGYVVGDGSAISIQNCSVTNSDISGYRDVGGIVGCTGNAAVSGNTVTDTVVSQNNTNAYGSYDNYNIGAVVGRSLNDVTVENNTQTNVIVTENGQ